MTCFLPLRGIPALFFLPAMIFLAACDQHAYYVSSSGSDENPGTRRAPFKTIARINNLTLNAGDAVYFMGGETFEGSLSLNINGTAGDSVVISSYGEGNAIIHAGNNEALVLRGSYFRISNLHVTGSGRKAGNTTNGVGLIDASHGIVSHVRAEGFRKSGVDLYNCTDVDVRNVLAINNGFAGIHVGGDAARRTSKRIRIMDCRAENNAGDPTNLDNHSGNGILVGQSDSVLIDHCVATNNGWDMPRIGNGPVGIWAYECSNVIIQYCISYGNKTSKGSKDGGGFDFDGGITNSVIQYCLSYDNEGAGYGLFQYDGASLWHNNVLRYCVSINDATTTEGSGGIFVWNGSLDSVQLADCRIHNNLVYTTRNPAVQFEPNSLNKNFRFFNNIFIGSGAIVNGPTSGEDFSGNVWWRAEDSEITFRGYGLLADWSAATGQERIDGEIKGRQADPLLNGPISTRISDPYELHTLVNYMLRDDSPVINSGITLDPLPGIPLLQHDFYGSPVPQGTGPEPGIHEIDE